MPRFFVRASQIFETERGKRIEILGDDASHITKSLRMKPGEEIIVCDMAGIEYTCTVTVTGEIVEADVICEKQSENEPPYIITVYQALVKGDKFDTVVQKAVECGASRIVPVRTSRATVKLDEQSGAKKQARWQRIADEAAKQCGRGRLPEILNPMNFADALGLAASDDMPIFCYEDEHKSSLRDILCKCRSEIGIPHSVSVFVGPEGGFSLEEAAYAMDKGLISAGLGPRILRTETASSFALACVCCMLEM